MADITEPRWRDRSKIGALMSRLERHAMGDLEMTKTQITAAQIFLKKVVPDLSAATLSGDPEKPLFGGDYESRIAELTRKAGIVAPTGNEAPQADA